MMPPTPRVRTFWSIFDRERSVYPGSLFLGIGVSIAIFCTNYFKTAPPVIGIVLPFGSIILIEYVFRFSDWVAYKVERWGHAGRSRED